MKSKSNFTKFYNEKSSFHLYPTEWIVRTLLGSYPEMSLNREEYKGAKILDAGYGDGRNFPVLHNCAFSIYGLETSGEINELVKEKMNKLGIPVNLKQGTNSAIPFGNNFFDFLLSSFSWYYIEKEKRFDDNLIEYHRVIKPGGILIATLAAAETFIFKDGIDKGDGHIEITNDPFLLRNGDILKCFYSEDEIKNTLSPYFKEIKIGRSINDYYGLSISYYMVVCKK